MRKKMVTLLVLSIALCVIFTSCGGGGAKVEQTTSSQTLGQELTDLDKAYKDGIITEKQYEKSKKALLKKYK